MLTKERFQNYWFSVVTGKISTQFLLFVFILLLGTLSISFLTYLGTWQLDISQFYPKVRRIFEVLIFQNREDKEIGGYWGMAYGSYVFVIGAVWQSLFIFKLMTKHHNLRFSTIMTFYSKCDNRHLETKDYLVFRLMNNGSTDLYNVSVKVILRFYHTKSKTYQHYICNTPNQYLPVLEKNMPFRIYVDCGEIEEAVDKKLLLPNDPRNCDSIISFYRIKDEISLNKRSKTADVFIIYVEGLDVEMNQTKAAVNKYYFEKLNFGRFFEINPMIQDEGAGKTLEVLFSKKEIDAKFDTVENNGTWPSLSNTQLSAEGLTLS